MIAHHHPSPDCGIRNASSECHSALDSWYRAMKNGAFRNIAELKAVFPSADLMRKDVFVFNIGGNTVRLVASVDFVRQRVYILAILTHAEYDKDQWK